jgi:hypothetical protein
MTKLEKLEYLEGLCERAGVPNQLQLPFALQMLNIAKNEGVDVTEIKLSKSSYGLYVRVQNELITQLEGE